MWVVVLPGRVGALFDFMNGFHDAGQLDCHGGLHWCSSPRRRCCCGVLQLHRDFVFHLSVAATVGKGIVQPGVVDTHVVFGAL